MGKKWSIFVTGNGPGLRSELMLCVKSYCDRVILYCNRQCFKFVTILF